MKKHLLPVFLLSALCSFGQAPSIKWQKSLGGSSTDKGNAVCQTTDGHYVVAGETISSDGDVSANNGTTDYWVAKVDSANGALIWQKNLGGSGDDRGNAVAATADGGCIVAGTSNSPSGSGDIIAPKGQYDFWVVKLTPAGAIDWKKNFGGTAIDEARAIQQTVDGGYIIAGESRSNNFDLTGNNGMSDFWVVKTDNMGAIQWQKNLGGSGEDIARSVHQTSDGGYIVAGETNSTGGDVSGNNGGVDFWVVKLTSAGQIIWQKCLGGSATDVAYSVKQTSDGGYIIGGKTASTNGQVTGNNGPENAWIVKLNPLGALSWQDCYGSNNGFDAANSVIQTADGGYAFAGIASSGNTDITGHIGSNDYWVVKLSTTGAISWQKCLGGTSSDVAMGLLQTIDNGYVVAGRSASSANDITNPKGLDDFWVVKFKGVMLVTGMESYGLNNAGLSIYPNPGQGVFNIHSSEGGRVNIINAAGQLVYSADIEKQNEQVDLSGMAKGLYLLQLSDASGAVTGTAKLIVE